MPRTPRQHGTLAMRKRGECQTNPCEACYEAGARYRRRNAKMRRRGTVALVDAEPARRRVLQLLEQEMSVVQIQNLSGVNRTAIRVLIGDFPNRKPSIRIRPQTAQALLRVPIDKWSAIAGLTPATGTQRRLQALRRMGYTRSDIAQRLAAKLGQAPTPQLQVGRSESGMVRSAVAIAVDEIYRELADTPGPSDAARRYAIFQGYLAPVWWDDDTIDDPDAKPEGLREYRQASRVLVDDISEPRVKRVVRMHARGLTDEEIAARIPCSQRQVRRDLLERSKR